MLELYFELITELGLDIQSDVLVFRFMEIKRYSVVNSVTGNMNNEREEKCFLMKKTNEQTGYLSIHAQNIRISMLTPEHPKSIRQRPLLSCIKYLTILHKVQPGINNYRFQLLGSTMHSTLIKLENIKNIKTPLRQPLVVVVFTKSKRRKDAHTLSIQYSSCD